MARGFAGSVWPRLTSSYSAYPGLRPGVSTRMFSGPQSETGGELDDGKLTCPAPAMLSAETLASHVFPALPGGGRLKPGVGLSWPTGRRAAVLEIRYPLT